MISEKLYNQLEVAIKPLVDTYGYIPTHEMEKLVQSLNQRLAPVVAEGYDLSDSDSTLYELINADATLKDAFAEGASMGFSAEIQKNFSQLPPVFAESLQNYKMEQLYEAKPVRAIGTEILGTLVPTLATRGVGLLRNKPAEVIVTGTQPKKPLMTKISKYFAKSPVRQAGVYGGVYGLGKTEGPIAERFSKKQPYLTALTAMVTQGVTQGLAGMAGSAIDMISSAGSEQEAEEVARRIVLNALMSDSENIDEAFVEAAEKMKLGKEITLADMGPNSRGALDLVNMLPGRGRAVANKFLQERASGRFGRLETDLKKAFGMDADYYESLQAITEAKKSVGAERYKSAFYKDNEARIVPIDTKFRSSLVDPTTGEEEVLEVNLEQLFKRPAFRDAFDRASRLAANDGKDGFVTINKQGQIMFEGGELDGQFPDGISTEFLHYIKMGMDEQISVANSPLKTEGSIGRTELRQINKLKKHLVNILDTNEDYRIARNTFAGDAAIQDAMLAGREILKPSSEMPEVLMNGMGNSEQEAFRLGVQQAILDELEKGTRGTDLAKKVFRSELRDKMIRQTFPEGSQGDKMYETFKNNFINEMETRATEVQVLKGSQTAQREANKKMADEMLMTAVSRKDLDVKNVLASAVGNDFPALHEEQREVMALKIAEILTETDLKKAEKLLRRGEGLANVFAKIDPLTIPKFLKTLINLPASPYVTGDVASIFLDELDKQVDVESSSEDMIDSLKGIILQDLNKENLQGRVDNFERTVPSSVAKKVLPEQKESLGNQLDQMLASFQPSNIPLVPPATAVRPQDMLSETILPNPKDRELAERLAMRSSGIGSLA